MFNGLEIQSGNKIRFLQKSNNDLISSKDIILKPEADSLSECY